MRMKDVVNAAMTDLYTLFLMSDGSLYGIISPSWLTYYADWPPFFLDSLSPVEESIPVKLIEERVVEVSADNDHIMVIMEDNSLWGWGRNLEGSVGFGLAEEKTAHEPVFEPTKIMNNVAYVLARGECTAVVTSTGELWSWGWNFMMTHGRINSAVPLKLLNTVSQ